MSMPCQYHVNTNTRSIPRQCQVNNTAIPRQYHVKSTSIPCPYHVRTTSIPRHYRVYTTSIPIPGSPQLVCASHGPCALVCPCLPRSWSCVLGRVWFVCARVCLCALVPARVSACFARSCSCVLVPASACSCVHRILRVWKALGCEAESMRKTASWSSRWSPPAGHPTGSIYYILRV